MCVTNAVIRSVVVLVLLVNAGGKRWCNYTEILGTYSTQIVPELRILNLTTSYNDSKEKRLCTSGKEHRILGSIYKMTQWTWCQIGRKQSDLSRPLESMEQVIIYNCSPHYLDILCDKMASSVVEMDPDVARNLFVEGATLVLLGVPRGTELGIDCKSWQVGPKFRGVKMIPPGLHFLHYSSVNSPNCGSEIGPKTGLFLTLKPREILLANWDAQGEDLDFSASKNEEEVSKIRANLQELDPHLGPYPYDVMRKWVSLTDRLNEDLAIKLQPLSGRICAFSDVIPELQFTHTKDRAEQPRNDTACQSMREGLDRLPKMKLREGTELRFSVIPEKTYPPGATPAEITQCSLDYSYALDTVLEKYYQAHPLNLLGELQFAFVCFLIGNVYEGFEHWKKLLALLCRSEEAMRKNKDLYLGLIAVLYHQLGEIPPDFFVDIVSQNNFLTSTLQDFFQFACGPGVDSTLRKRAEKFKAHLTKKFRWDFDADLDDCAPVVVELPEGFTVN